ncbi:MAG: hypothetical protein U1F98_01985 [Verrucomicrobiota bacterium]
MAGLLLGFWLIYGGIYGIRHPKLVMTGVTQQAMSGTGSDARLLVPTFTVSHTGQVFAGVRLAAGIVLAGWILVPWIRESRGKTAAK